MSLFLWNRFVRFVLNIDSGRKRENARCNQKQCSFFHRKKPTLHTAEHERERLQTPLQRGAKGGILASTTGPWDTGHEKPWYIDNHSERADWEPSGVHIWIVIWKKRTRSCKPWLWVYNFMYFWDKSYIGVSVGELGLQNMDSLVTIPPLIVGDGGRDN